jgi:hypothetical protein
LFLKTFSGRQITAPSEYFKTCGKAMLLSGLIKQVTNKHPRSGTLAKGRAWGPP